nr:hypothetical protein [Acidimicrobiia bacterium]
MDLRPAPPLRRAAAIALMMLAAACGGGDAGGDADPGPDDTTVDVPAGPIAIRASSDIGLVRE